MDQNYAEQQSRQDQIIYSRIKRVIAYKTCSSSLSIKMTLWSSSRHTCRAAWRTSGILLRRSR